MEKGLECHAREPKHYAKGHGETLEGVSRDRHVRLGLQKDHFDSSGKWFRVDDTQEASFLAFPNSSL